jgi:hypothetical protein
MKKENRWNEGNRWKQGWPLEEGEPLEGGEALRDMTMTLVQTTMALLVSCRQRACVQQRRSVSGMDGVTCTWTLERVQSCTMRLLRVWKDTIHLQFLMSHCPQTWENMCVRATVFMDRCTVLNFRA